MSDATAVERKARADRRWLIGLTIIGVIYLVFELGFNATIVDLAFESPGSTLLADLETHGRVLAAFGFVLLMVKLLRPWRWGTTVAVLLILLIAGAGGPAMYHGQKALVDGLVDRTDGEDRAEAMYVTLLKRGIAERALEIAGIELDAEALDSAEGRSFLITLGALSFISPDLTQRLRDNSDAILGRLADTETQRRLPDGFAAYREAEAQIAGAYDGYADAMQTRAAALADAEGEIEARWRDLNARLLAEWEEGRDRFSEEELPRHAVDLRNRMTYYFEAKPRCGRRIEPAGCPTLDSDYRRDVTALLGRYVPPEYWCFDDESYQVQTRVGARLVQRTVTREGSCEDLTADHIAAKLRSAAGDASDFGSFLASDLATTAARDALTESGVTMPQGWTPADRAGFDTALRAHAAAEADRALAEAMEAQLGFALPPDLGPEAFVAHPQMQRVLKDALGAQVVDATIPLNLEAEAFRTRVLDPIARDRLERERQRLAVDPATLADGGANAERGRAYVYSLLIPTIALAFSLFFSLANFVTLLGDMLKLSTGSARLASLTKTVGLLAVVLLPLTVGPRYLDSPSFRFLLEGAERFAGPVAGATARWTLTVEPLLYPIAKPAAVITAPFRPSADEGDMDHAST